MSAYPEDNKAACANASAPHPAESKTPGMHRNFTRENREAPSPSVGSRIRTAGRRRRAIKAQMYGDGEWSGGIVPAKRSNEGLGRLQEIVEGRLPGLGLQ